MIRWMVCLVVAAVAATPVLWASERYGNQKVVYHVSAEGGEASKAYVQALTNVQNHIDAVGRDHIQVAVVMHGDGLNLLKEAKGQPKLQTSIRALKAQGVQFDVCNNTLVNRRIDWEKDLFEVAQSDIVPAGVAELARLQQQGYTYIKP